MGSLTFWFVFTIVACVCSAITSVMGIFNYESREGRAHRLFGSLGCSLLWINLVRYLQYNRNYYMVILTMRRGGPRVLRFMVGVLPIMMGYAFFGMTYFGSESDRFETFGASMVTLFAVLNGDVIRETFLNLMPIYPVMSQVYLYSFICLFMYVVLNVFIAIIEEAFFVSAAVGKKAANQESAEFHGHGAVYANSTYTNDAASDNIAFRSSSKTSSEASDSVVHGASKSIRINGGNRDPGTFRSGNLVDEAENASSKSWSRFQEFLHVNNIDEVMGDIDASPSGTGMTAPLLNEEISE